MKTALISIIVFVSLVQIGQGQMLSRQVKSLEGTPNIFVFSDIDAQNEIYLGIIDETWLKTKVELACRKSGIAVVDTFQQPMLRIDLHVMRLDTKEVFGDYYFYTISLSVVDRVAIGRAIANKIIAGEPWGNTSTVEAITWSYSYLGGSPKKYFQDEMSDSVSNLMDTFINDYLAANPKDDG